jgi:hypothetical protein
LLKAIDTAKINAKDCFKSTDLSQYKQRWAEGWAQYNSVASQRRTKGRKIEKSKRRIEKEVRQYFNIDLLHLNWPFSYSMQCERLAKVGEKACTLIARPNASPQVFEKPFSGEPSPNRGFVPDQQHQRMTQAAFATKLQHIFLESIEFNSSTMYSCMYTLSPCPTPLKIICSYRRYMYMPHPVTTKCY